MSDDRRLSVLPPVAALTLLPDPSWGFVQLEFGPWRGAVDASLLLIGEIDPRARARGSLT
jgi:hypothetical protein